MNEKELRVLLLKLIATFFILGLVVEILIFPHVNNWLLFLVYVLSDLMLPLAYLLFRKGWMDENQALIMQSLAVSAAQYTDMVVRITTPGPNTGHYINSIGMYNDCTDSGSRNDHMEGITFYTCCGLYAYLWHRCTHLRA